MRGGGEQEGGTISEAERRMGQDAACTLVPRRLRWSFTLPTARVVPRRVMATRRCDGMPHGLGNLFRRLLKVFADRRMVHPSPSCPSP